MCDYYIVLDFEATCELRDKPDPREIIELPSVVLHAKTRKVVDEIQFYIKPQHHPRLSEFCTELTGITQKKIDNGISFQDGFRQYNQWLAKYPNATFVTWGAWDLKYMLPRQCRVSKLTIPDQYKQFVNLKQEYQCTYHFLGDMVDSLKHLGMDMRGRHHSGIDDCRNICRILVYMLRNGYTPQITQL